MRNQTLIAAILCATLVLATGCENGNLQKQITEGQKANLIPEGASNVEYKGPNYVTFQFEGKSYLLYKEGEGNAAVAALTEMSGNHVPPNTEGTVPPSKAAAESTIHCTCPKCKARLVITPLGPVELVE